MSNGKIALLALVVMENPALADWFFHELIQRFIAFYVGMSLPFIHVK